MTSAYDDEEDGNEYVDRQIDTVKAFLDRMAREGDLDPTPSPQCRVCRNELVRTLVNKLFARMFTINDVLEVLEPHNRTQKANQRVTWNSLRRHRRDHFPIQVPTSAVLRRLAEQRAKEQGRNVDTATGTLVDAMSYLEMVAIRGMEQITDPDIPVSGSLGMKAVVKLDEIRRANESHMERAQMLAQMNRVIELVRTYIPKEQWPALQAALSGDATAVEAVMAEKPQVRMVQIADAADEEDER